MNLFKFYCIISGSLVVSLSGQAANVIPLDDSNINTHFTINQKSLIGTKQGYGFTLTKTVTLPDGVKKRKYTQLYENIPVFNQILTSSEISGVQSNWQGEMLADIQDDIKNMKPALDEQTVLALVQKNIKGIKVGTIQNEKAKLYVRMNQANKAELIYLVSFYVEGQGQLPKRPFFMVNAHTGKIIESWDGLTTKEAQGPGGNEKVGQYFYGRDYSSLQVTDNCTMSNPNVETYDMKNQTSGTGTLFQFVCPTNYYKYVNGAYSPLNDAHYFAGMVKDMYKDWYNVDPLNGKLKVRVHFGTGLEQAFWDGLYMSFGDGLSPRTYPFTSLDIMGHEVSHGVTEKNSDLVYTKQSGGINEAFSDMAGEAVEDFMANKEGNNNDWMLGAMIIRGAPDAALRYFKNPTQDGRSIDNASKYNDTMNVHFSSGVYNKAFYLIATKPSWDIRKAFGVFLLANQMYWKPESTFDSAACGVVKAANDLKYEVNDVISAFDAVGVNARCEIPDPTPVPGKEIVIINGNVINNISIKKGDERRYVLQVPVVRVYPYSYDILYMRLANKTGTTSKNAEMFVRYENGPLQKLKPQPGLKAGLDADELFIINFPASGNYHILIKGKGADTLSLLAFYGNKA
ncbi:MAG: peptidase M4 family protein [Legionella sp.]|nr:peptidase M4 family protein [Legionella sp.]